MASIRDISVLSAHFGDISWTSTLVASLRKTTDPVVLNEILLIDQNRVAPSAAALANLDPRVRVLSFPKSPRHFQIQGHDHAAVLNQSLTAVRGEWLALFDSDCFPTSGRWLQDAENLLRGRSALLAQEPHKGGLSHPCFMLIHRSHLADLCFDKGLFETKVDTGRRIYAQLQAAGARPLLLPPRLAHGGWWGNTYMKSIYHHGHGSFAHGEIRLSRQCAWDHEFFTRRVLAVGVRRLTVGEWVQLLMRHATSDARRTGGVLWRTLRQSAGFQPF